MYNMQITGVRVIIFKYYAPVIVITKYWLYSLCCTVYTYSEYLSYT